MRDAHTNRVLSRLTKGVLISLACLLLTACLSTPRHTDRQLVFDTTIRIGDIPINVVVFDTPDSREYGLMDVDKLAMGTGALFIFERAGNVGFWMKNTLIPLDMLFFDAAGKAVKFITDVPPCKVERCPTYQAPNTRYVVEVPAGFVLQHQLKQTARLEL